MQQTPEFDDEKVVSVEDDPEPTEEVKTAHQI